MVNINGNVHTCDRLNQILFPGNSQPSVAGKSVVGGEPSLESLYTYEVENFKTEDEFKSEHESHCDKCFSVRKCQKLNILRANSPKEVIDCPIVLCRLLCGHEFHECKRDEHNLLCSKVKVCCVNAGNGCPMVMERRLIAKHLETCPASVVVCTMEWNRWPMPYGENPVVIELGKNQLDLEFLRRDERTAAEWREQLPQRLRNCLKTALNSKYPVMPLGVSGNRIPYCITSENMVEKVGGNLLDQVGESEHDDSSDSPWGAKRSPPGLQESVCNKLAPSGKERHADKTSGSLDGDKVTLKPIDPNPRLNPIVEIVPRSKIKPRNIFTFMCAREFRRDEYAGHFQYVHSAVLTQLNGWLFNRCPMAAQGCSFGVERMFPLDSNHRIIYNKDVDAFCTTQIDCDIVETEPKDTVSGEYYQPTVLCDIPFEVLVHLTQYLDPLSLSSLSMTCSLMREVCAFVVVNRGIVVLQWEKTPSEIGWEVVSKKWLFSTSFSPIRKWSFADVGRLSNHIKNCPCYERQISDKPFSYYVTLDDL
ncbi:unnamed protein product [Allacma fusca]|uniref:F-box protein 40 n=1 Tax=Allacma fusca TaxID=39272 RepID=A0A8J2PC62_9HEXA|nr:unnamed protein product [Allacma fusca]